MKKNIKLAIAGLLVIIIAFAGWTAFAKMKNQSNLGENNSVYAVTLYKSEFCGCCDLYSNYISKKLGKIVITDVPDVSPIKDQYGVPDSLRSCHTTIVEGYFIEGHIPVEAIIKLMNEKPDIAGIAMPGMPSGSPVMPGTKKGDFVIFAVNKDGSQYEFMRM